MKNKAVFVDIDYTLLDGVTLNMLAFHFLKKRKITLMSFVRLMYWYIKYKMNILKDFRSVLRHAFNQTESWEIDSTNQLIKECFETRVKPRLYKKMIDVIRKHHEEGFRVIFVSSTITPIANLIIEYFGFGEALVTETEIEGTRYTGAIVGDVCFGPEKIRRIRSHIDNTGIDLSHSYAYTDHVSDIPMLQFVGHPVVVNPNIIMRLLAFKNKWEIIKTKEILKHT